MPAGRLNDYAEDERVYDFNEAGHRALRKHEKGKFIYRLAGRDRQKSASYYTPQVLTQCLVKYALKELLASERVKTADDILTLTVCEPAMGSAAFLNEAVNQLADAYLAKKQEELGRRIPHDDYAQELQKVRMVIADRNVYGVDLNPVAVELAEVSLWLNAIYGETDGQGRPLPARVPWFGYQLFAGNSLIGARDQVYAPGSLGKKSDPKWYDMAPRDVTTEAPRTTDEIWHFLLPDPGMANYTPRSRSCGTNTRKRSPATAHGPRTRLMSGRMRAVSTTASRGRGRAPRRKRSAGMGCSMRMATSPRRSAASSSSWTIGVRCGSGQSPTATTCRAARNGGWRSAPFSKATSSM